MFEGNGTVKPSWQQAGDLITQQTHIMITELAEGQRQLSSAKREVEHAKRALESYKANPDSYSEGWYVKELGKSREKVQALQNDILRLREFMRMKDEAKIKVERTRDVALRKVKNLTEINELLRSKAVKSESLVAENEQQAIAWKRAVQEKHNVQLENARLKDENARLMEVLRLGREGLKNEQW